MRCRLNENRELRYDQLCKFLDFFVHELEILTDIELQIGQHF